MIWPTKYHSGSKMAQEIQRLPLEVLNSVKLLGERVRAARLRRQLSTDDLAKACGLGRRTLYRIETGEPGVAIGSLLAVLWKLGLLNTVRAVADPDDDEHGKILEAARRPQRVRAPAPDNDF